MQNYINIYDYQKHRTVPINMLHTQKQQSTACTNDNPSNTHTNTRTREYTHTHTQNKCAPRREGFEAPHHRRTIVAPHPLPPLSPAPPTPKILDVYIYI